MRHLTEQQVADESLPGWAQLGNGLYTRVTTPDFATGLALVNAIGEAAVAAHRDPGVDLRAAHVDVALVSHHPGVVSEGDVALAREIGTLAAAAGLSLDGSGVSRVNLALDTPVRRAVQPFWRAFLAYEDRPGTDRVVRDPAGRLPMVWFQSSGSAEPRQRWHLDVWLDPSRVQSRIEACLTAGGRLVDDSQAPAFWVLADPDGNRSCLATWQGRE
jgi:4a-hydroxytetrahydrobiopterin dehydratase